MRTLALKDCNPAFTKTDLSRGFMLARLEIINTLNDMQGSLRGLDSNCPYMVGDIVACKLNLVRMKSPRKNPDYIDPRVITSRHKMVLKAVFGK